MNLRSMKPQVLLAAALLAWVIVGAALIPWIIRSAYAGESLSFFNRLIEGRGPDFPVDSYLRQWSPLFHTGTAVLSTALLLTVLPRSFRRAVIASFYTPIPAFFLDVARIVCVATQMLLLARPGSLAYLKDVSRLPDGLFAPLPILRLMLLPFGSDFRPGLDALLVIHWITLAAGALALIGFRTRMSLLAFAFGSTLRQAYLYSFGELHHPEAPMIITLWVLAFGSVGASLSLDSSLSGARSFDSLIERAREKLFAAAWPLRTVQVLLAIVYLDAGVQKLFYAGLDWVNGSTLRFYLLRDGWVRGSQLALSFANQPDWFLQILSWTSLIFESTFWLILFVPSLIAPYLAVGFGFHIANAVLSIAPFYEFMAVYVVFLPQLAQRFGGSRPGTQESTGSSMPAVSREGLESARASAIVLVAVGIRKHFEIGA